MPTPTPVSLPRPAVHVDGTLNPSLTADLTMLVVEEAISSPARCLARFLNVGTTGGQPAGFKYFALHDFDFGRLLTIWQGQPPVTLFRLFEGRIHLVEGDYPAGAPPHVLVQAQDALREFRTKQRTRVFEHMSDAQIIQALAGEHGLTADIRLTGSLPVHAQVAQLNESDGAFLFDRVMAAGAEMWVDQQTLVVTDGTEPGHPAALAYGQDLVAISVRADVSHQRTAIGVSGWDMRAKAFIGASASDVDLPPAGILGESGGRIVEAAFGQRLATLVDAVPLSQEEAKSLAVALHRKQSAEFVTGEGVALNAPGLRAGRTVDLQGLGSLFSGSYYVTRVRHRFDRVHGLRTEFEVRRTRLGRPEKTHLAAQEAADAHRDPAGARTPGRRSRPRTGGARRGPRRTARS